MLSRSGALLAQHVKRACGGQGAVLASAFATSSAAAAATPTAAHNLQHHAAHDGGQAQQSAAPLGDGDLNKLRRHLADGDAPSLDDFIAGREEASASPYSVYAPNFKVSRSPPGSSSVAADWKYPNQSRKLPRHLSAGRQGRDGVCASWIYSCWGEPYISALG